MTWVRIDDSFARHRKVAPLSDRAFRLHVTLLCECAHQLTDGWMPLAVLPTLPSAPRGKALRATIQELVDAGLWREESGKIFVHDFLAYNKPRAEVIERREANAHRVTEHRNRKKSRGSGRGNADGNALHERYDRDGNADVTPTYATGNADVTLPPIPIPIGISEDDDPRPSRSGAPEPSAGSSSSSSPGCATARGAASSELDGIDDTGRETPCPLDLVERFTGFAELAARWGVAESELRRTAEAWVGYWTCGGGVGQRRRQWARRLREELRRCHDPRSERDRPPRAPRPAATTTTNGKPASPNDELADCLLVG